MLNEALNKSQRDAILGKELNKVIVAPPGSGKTFSLVNAIINFRENYPNGEIVAITFTRVATFEMVSRLEEHHIENVKVQTIHSWSRDQLLKLADKYKFKVYIMEAPQIMRILNSLISNHRTKVNPDILFSYVNGNKKMDISDGFRRTLECLEEKYIKYKRDNDLYDFTDYPFYLYKMLRKYNEIITDVVGLFVDEFQDVDPVQAAIFDLVVCEQKFYIGDFKQAIYQFRGADVNILHKLKNFTQYTLNINYRSYQEILDYADTVYDKISTRIPDSRGTLITTVTDYKPSQTKCDRGRGGELYISNVFGQTWDNTGERCDTKNVITSFIANGAMILCRTNRQVKAFEECGYYNVSTVHQAKGLEYDSVIVIDEPIKTEEDLNIAYVAMTRAKDRLFVGAYQIVLKTVRENSLY